MADVRISELEELTDPSPDDEIPIVDKSDITATASGTTKRITGTNVSKLVDHASLSNLGAGDPHPQYLARTGGTLQGDLDVDDHEVVAPSLRDVSEVVQALGTVTNSLAIDYTVGGVVTATLGGSPTVVISNPPPGGGGLTIIVTQDATGNRSITWPASFKWPGGDAPNPAKTPGSVCIYSAFTPNAGGVWYAFLSGEAMA